MLDFAHNVCYYIVVERDNSTNLKRRYSSMAHKKKKSKRAKQKFDWKPIFVSALLDLVVGTILLVIGKLLE